MLSDHYRSGMTERLIVRIVTSDSSTRRIEGVGKDAAVIQIESSSTPGLFVWPKQGEYWTIVRENGTWGIENKVLGPDDRVPLQPGEGLTIAEKIWTPSGDYLIRKTELDAQTAALDARLDTVESYRRLLMPTAVGSIDLGAINGNGITGVRITGNIITSGTGGNTQVRLKPNALASISVSSMAHAALWDTAVTSTDTASYAGNFASAPGLLIAGHGWGVTSNGIWFDGIFYTSLPGTGGRKYLGQYANHDYVTNAQRHSFATMTSYWNDGITPVTSLTLSVDNGTFSGRVAIEIVP